jgi:hypothetical protein
MPEPTTPAEPAGQPAPAAPPAAGTPTPTPPAGDPPKDTKDEPLGEGGLKALQAEREARKALEKKLEGLAPLEKLAAALGADPAKGKSEIEQITERLANHEQQLLEANTARWRAEIANTAGLTVEQAAELRGTTREELAAHAERLKALFPSVPPAPGTPRPDPSQGGQGGAGVNLDTQILEAQKAGKWRDVITLQNQKLTQ